MLTTAVTSTTAKAGTIVIANEPPTSIATQRRMGIAASDMGAGHPNGLLILRSTWLDASSNFPQIHVITQTGCNPRLSGPTWWLEMNASTSRLMGVRRRR